MHNGVLSPKEKTSLPMMKLLLKSLVDEGKENTPLVFSVPAEPIDKDFDIFFHTEMLKSYFSELGFLNPTEINEAFAIAFSELLEDNLTGVTISFGAGLTNISLCHEGESILQFSIARGGDWIDAQASKAVDEKQSLIQIEKEGGIDINKPGNNKMHEAISVYYKVLIRHVIKNISNEFNKVKLPSFRENMPVVVSGGLTLAGGFMKYFKEEINNIKLPFEIKDIRKAKDPMTCVAHGCLMAAIL
jgi:hypothetical protein